MIGRPNHDVDAIGAPGEPAAMDGDAQAAVEGRLRPEPLGATAGGASPPAGPHADPGLMTEANTPGAGAIAPPGPGDATEATTG